MPAGRQRYFESACRVMLAFAPLMPYHPSGFSVLLFLGEYSWRLSKS